MTTSTEENKLPTKSRFFDIILHSIQRASSGRDHIKKLAAQITEIILFSSHRERELRTHKKYFSGKRPRPQIHFLFDEDLPEEEELLTLEELLLPPFSSSLEAPFWWPLSLSWASFLVRFNAAEDEDASAATGASSRS